MARVSPVLVLLALAAACSRPAEPRLGLVPIAEPMPALRGPTLDGGFVDAGDYRGKVVLVNFWATWCAPCRREQPFLQRIWERYRERGVAFIGVDVDDDPAAARVWVEDEFHVTYPSIVDQEAAWADDFGFVGLPATYLVDREGTMRYRILGEAREEDLTRALEELLAEGG